jgi:hypothetical protein
VPAADPAPVPGTFGRLWIPTAPQPVITLPDAAIQRIGQLDIVHVAQNDRAIRRLVKTGALINNEREILSGLEPGEQILLTPTR